MNREYKLYKCIIFLSVFYFACFIESAVLAHRLILIGNIVGSAATFIFPITYLCSDIVAEIYGYKVARQLIWCGLLCEILFAVSINLLIKLPAPIDWKLKSDYDIVLSPLLRICVSSFVSMGTGSFINIYLLTKWKILLKGRFFWLRSLLSSTIGELVFTVIAVLIIFYGNVPNHSLFNIMVTSYLFKVIFSPFAVLIANEFVRIIKKIENVDIYDYGTNFNPFKLSTNYKS